jgi:hypothetical protein
VPTNAKVEVGTRTIPEYHPNLAALVAYHPDDEGDLDSFWSLWHAGSLDQVRRPGYVAHLYLSVWDGFYRDHTLESTVTVWLGVEGAEPVLDTVDGRPVHNRGGER